MEAIITILNSHCIILLVQKNFGDKLEFEHLREGDWGRRDSNPYFIPLYDYSGYSTAAMLKARSHFIPIHA